MHTGGCLSPLPLVRPVHVHAPGAVDTGHERTLRVVVGVAVVVVATGTHAEERKESEAVCLIFPDFPFRFLARPAPARHARMTR